MDFQDITFQWIPFLAGGAVVVLLGFFVKPLIEHTTDYLRLTDNDPLWLDLRLPGGAIGNFERALFYITLVGGYPIFIGAWLAFKVAAKWDTWAHIVRLPELSEENLNSNKFEARYRFSVWVLSRFLIVSVQASAST